MRPRPLLAALSTLPLLAAVGLAAFGPDPHAETVDRAAAAATAASAAAVCPGPLTVSEESGEGSGDQDLALRPPSQTAHVSAAALGSSSPLLAGSTDALETAVGTDGKPTGPALATSALADEAGGDAPEASGGTTATGALDDTVASGIGIAGALAVTAESASGTVAAQDVVQSTTTTEGDYRSSALTRCAQPTTSATFLGASTATGHSATLILRNVSDRPATASIRAWDTDGAAELSASPRVVVAPRSVQRVLLESLVPDRAELAVAVDTEGSPLAMNLQVTARDGLTPGGAEMMTALPDPDADGETVIPGIRAGAGHAPVALILNSRRTAAHVDLAVDGAEGEIEGAARSGLEIPGGSLVAVPLENVFSGDAVLRATASDGSELQVAVRSSAAGTDLPGDTVGTPVDTDVASGAAAIGSTALLALPAETPQAGALLLHADAATSATVIPVRADGSAGEARTIELPARASVRTSAADLGVDGAAAAGGLVIIPAEPGTVRGTWVQSSSTPDSGALLSTLVVPGATPATTDPVVRAG